MFSSSIAVWKCSELDLGMVVVVQTGKNYTKNQ